MQDNVRNAIDGITNTRPLKSVRGTFSIPLIRSGLFVTLGSAGNLAERMVNEKLGADLAQSVGRANGRIKRLTLAFVAPLQIFYDKATNTELEHLNGLLPVNGFRITNLTQIPAKYESAMFRTPYSKNENELVSFSFHGLSLQDHFIYRIAADPPGVANNQGVLEFGAPSNMSIVVEFLVHIEYPRQSLGAPRLKSLIPSTRITIAKKHGRRSYKGKKKAYYKTKGKSYRRKK